MQLNHRKAAVPAAALLVASAALLAAPSAQAADTTVTMEIEAGSLAISAPTTTVDLGDASPGDATSASLGTVTVTDDRASLTPDWEATVESTDFITGGGTAAETIGASEVTYTSHAATATTGTGTFTAGQLTTGVSLASSATAFSHAGGAGDNSASWNPTIEVAAPSTGVAGTYTGTITHSVA